MMTILIFSDSHGSAARMTEAYALGAQPDLVLFLGDGLRDLSAADFGVTPTFAVAGNCDLFSVGEPLDRFITIEEKKIFMTHGHKYGVKSSYGAVAAEALFRGADILLFGHTHRPVEKYLPAGSSICGVVTERPLYLFNPGSIGSGEFGVLTITDGNCVFGHGSL